jgi:CheY-like chemotaxis protein
MVPSDTTSEPLSILIPKQSSISNVSNTSTISDISTTSIDSSVPILPLPVSTKIGNSPRPRRLKTASEKIDPSQPKLNVLLIDDLAVNLRILRRMVEPLHCSCTEALNGAEALEHVKTMYATSKTKEDSTACTDSTSDSSPTSPVRSLPKLNKPQFDIILTDILMPVMDGLQFAAALRQFEKQNNLPSVPLAAMTANVFQHDKEQCYNSGVNFFLAKPFDRSAVTALLTSVRKHVHHNVPLPTHNYYVTQDTDVITKDQKLL